MWYLGWRDLSKVITLMQPVHIHEGNNRIVPVDGFFEWKEIAPFSRPIQCPKRESTIPNGLG